MADDRVGFHKALALLRKAKELVILAQARERSTLEALALDTEHVDHVELGENVVQAIAYMVGAENIGTRGHERTGGNDGDLGAHDLQGGDQRAADAGMADIANDTNLKAIEALLTLPN